MKRGPPFLASSSSLKKKHDAGSKPEAVADDNDFSTWPHLGPIEFTIESTKTPVHFYNIDGFYFMGTIQLVSCKQKPLLERSKLLIMAHNMPSCSPYFIYTSNDSQISKNNPIPTLYVDAKVPICSVRHKPLLTRSDILSLTEELCVKNFCPSLLETIKNTVPNMQVETQALHNLHLQPLELYTEFARIPMCVELFQYMFSKTSYEDVTKKKKHRNTLFDSPDLQDLTSLLRTRPWELVFRKKRPRLPRAGYEMALINYGVKPEQHIAIAMRIFFAVLDLQSDEKHTLFFKAAYNSFFPAVQFEERQALEAETWEFLMDNAFEWIEDGISFALKWDAWDARSTVRALEAIGSSNHGFPDLREEQVPVIPPVLTARQTEIAHYIQRNWLTIVQGAPGTGKTALITWCFSHYSTVLLTGFIGMLVKSLQIRNGGRKEAANTMHYFLKIYQEYPVPTKRLLSNFEVLVIDEFSTVSMHLLAKFIHMVQNNISKVVFVGDFNQLKPIDAGDPLSDLRTVFPVQELTENLRVVPELKALQDAPGHILSGHPERIEFSSNGPVSLMNKDDLVSVLRTIVGKTRGNLLDFHFVVLTHHGDGRKHLNKQIERILTSLGILQPPKDGGFKVRGQFRVYPGCKIEFSQNYNLPVVFDKVIYHTVSNGELAIVRNVSKVTGGTGCALEIEGPYNERKRVLIHSEHGIHPNHIGPGYASTTYKVQGREFPCVVFWNETNVRKFWTRPHAYVGASRAKERLWIASTLDDLKVLCSQPEKYRRSCFLELLKRARLPASEAGGEQNSFVLPVSELKLMPKTTLAVPTLKSVMEEMKGKEDE
jgi:hypothetical protein